ncbi:hypothetical protein R3P38DRAFT_2794674 [Favolaschia claudopus]|uniref:Uncharacterized protein n=1 Tax=Favolaschia claudopus TaxID=2862362 RepID=A0AAW0A8Q2_9AGAR
MDQRSCLHCAAEINKTVHPFSRTKQHKEIRLNANTKGRKKGPYEMRLTVATLSMQTYHPNVLTSVVEAASTFKIETGVLSVVPSSNRRERERQTRAIEWSASGSGMRREDGTNRQKAVRVAIDSGLSRQSRRGVLKNVSEEEVETQKRTRKGYSNANADTVLGDA